MPAPDTFRLILLDIGNVLLPFNLRKATSQFEKFARLSSEAILRAVMGTSLDRDFEKGKISPQNFYEEAKKRTGLSLPYEHFVAIWNDIFEEDEAVSRLARRLKERYPVALISNTNCLHFQFVHETFPIVQEIGHYILSFREGVRKPDPALFQVALKRFGVRPGETFYVDDRKDYVEAARDLGFVGHPFQDDRTLLSAFQASGLLGS